MAIIGPLLFLVMASSAPATAPAAAAGPEQASWEILYWGRRVFTWRVSANGEGEVRRVPGLQGSVDDPNATVQHFQVSPEDFGRLKAMIEGFMRRYAGHEIPCGNSFTDGPYGDISWQSQDGVDLVPLRFGCQSQEMRELIASANQIDAMVAALAGHAERR
jgi:hypothetical protein